MADNTPVAPNGIACGTTGVNTADNSWWRRFYFSEHPAVGASATINAVTIAVEDGPSVPVTVNLYTIPHGVAVDTIPLDQLTLIGSGSGTIGGTLQSVTIPVVGTVADTVGSDLVVEYHIDGAPTPFFPGGNPTPQTHPMFISSTSCGITTPTNPSAFGFPNFHVIMVVDVADGPPPSGCANPADIPWLDESPTSGAVAGGDSQDSTIFVDAAGLDAGTYSAHLCVATSDLTHALVDVPVTLTVGAAVVAPTLAKAFSPSTVVINTDSTLTLTLGNANAGVATLTSELFDLFPAGLVVATPDNALTTCPGGVLTANPGDDSLSLAAGAEIPASGTCTVSVNVRAATPGSYINTLGPGFLQTDLGDNAAPASATLTVTPGNAPTLTKAFAPSSVQVFTPSTLTITLGNSNAVSMTLTDDLVDNFPAGLVVAPSPNESTTCPGGFVNVVPGTDFVSLLQNPEIPPGGCTVTVDVQSAIAGTYVNTIPIGALQTNFGSNVDPATATLQVTAEPVPPTLAKAFAPSTVTVGTSSTLTLTLGNANGAVATLTMPLLDTFPSGLVVATPANASTTCAGGTVAASSGAGQISLSSGAGIPANGSCLVSVDVTSAVSGTYVNTIAAGALATTFGENATDATATLIVSPIVISDRIFCDGFDGIACPDFLQAGGFYGVLMTRLPAPTMAADRRLSR